MWTRQASRLVMDTGRSGTVTQVSPPFSMLMRSAGLAKPKVAVAMQGPVGRARRRHLSRRLHNSILDHEMGKAKTRRQRAEGTGQKKRLPSAFCPLFRAVRLD